MWWHRPVISAAWKAEAGACLKLAFAIQQLRETLSQKLKIKAKGVVQCKDPVFTTTPVPKDKKKVQRTQTQAYRYEVADSVEELSTENGAW